MSVLRIGSVMNGILELWTPSLGRFEVNQNKDAGDSQSEDFCFLPMPLTSEFYTVWFCYRKFDGGGGCWAMVFIIVSISPSQPLFLNFVFFSLTTSNFIFCSIPFLAGILYHTVPPLLLTTI